MLNVLVYYWFSVGSVARLPIPLSLLPDHIERMHLNENCGFVEEYKIIQENSPKNSVEICTTAENKPKNRYANIQCCKPQ